MAVVSARRRPRVGPLIDRHVLCLVCPPQLTSHPSRLALAGEPRKATKILSVIWSLPTVPPAAAGLPDIQLAGSVAAHRVARRQPVALAARSDRDCHLDPSSRSSSIPSESSSRSHNRPGRPCGLPPKKKPCCSRARRTSRADCLRPVRLCCRGKGTAQNSADCSRISHISFLSTVRICLYGLCTI